MCSREQVLNTHTLIKLTLETLEVRTAADLCPSVLVSN